MAVDADGLDPVCKEAVSRGYFVCKDGESGCLNAWSKRDARQDDGRKTNCDGLKIARDANAGEIQPRLVWSFLKCWFCLQ